jgi:hypothetical protein
LAKLGIDDKPPSLAEAEKQATVRDLVMARSGVYHPAAYETADIRQKHPARCSHAAGTFWLAGRRAAFLRPLSKQDVDGGS